MMARLRVMSNFGLILGQYILLFVSRRIGLAIIIFSSIFSLPYFYKERMWDVIMVISTMLGINIAGLFVK